MLTLFAPEEIAALLDQVLRLRFALGVVANSRRSDGGISVKRPAGRFSLVLEDL